MPVWLQTTLLLIVSNLFMTYAWYGHLKTLNDKKWYIVAIISWGVALFEYLIQVPANRIGYTELSLPQLKILQEVISLAVFVPFSLFVIRYEPASQDRLYLCRHLYSGSGLLYLQVILRNAGFQNIKSSQEFLSRGCC